MDKTLISQAEKLLVLRAIVLYEGNLKRFGEANEAKELGQQNKLIVRGEIGEALEHTEALHLFRVFVELGVRVIEPPTEQGQDARPLFQIEAVFQVDYELTDDVGTEALEEFARYNAVHNVWPFWRQFVFSTANQASLPCPEIPLMKSNCTVRQTSTETNQAESNEANGSTNE